MKGDPTTLLILLVLFLCERIQTMSALNLQDPLWTFEFKSIHVNSSNEQLLRFYEWKIERLSRGVFAVSGNYDLNFDIVKGDTNEVEAQVYRSENGVKPYLITPFRLQRQHYLEFYNSYYKQFVMDMVKNCSNFPVFVDKIELPVEKTIYFMNKCQFSTDAFPRYMSEGFYKIATVGYGTVEWTLDVVAEVTST